MSSGMDNKYSTATYNLKGAWHGRGIVKPNGITEDDLKIQYNWEPMLIPAYAYNPNSGMPMQIPGKRVIGRQLPDGSFDPFDIVGPDYTPVYNQESPNGDLTLVEFFKPWLESSDLTVESALTLFNGRKVAICCKLNESLSINGDRNWGYITLSNSNDGSTGLNVHFVSFREDCANMLAMGTNAATRAGKIVNLRHSKNVGTALAMVRDTIDLANRQFIATIETLRELDRYSVNTATIKRFQFAWSSVKSPEAALAEYDLKTQAQRIQEANGEAIKDRSNSVLTYLEAAYQDKSMGNKGKSLNDLVQAATQYTTHERGRGNDEDRLHDNLYGNGKALQSRAVTVAQLIASGK